MPAKFLKMRRVVVLALLVLLPLACTTVAPAAEPQSTTVTLLFTNDFESAYEPTPAFWRDDIENIGGIAHLATLVEDIRDAEPNVFLFDAGDIFTGTLSKLSRGALAFELMITMGYDAMAVGNHEFEYGWQVFARQKNRAPFPVLASNLFYKGTDHPYAQPYAIIERNGVRIGVIGVLGQDAATALIPSNIAGVDVRDPVPIVAGHVRELRPEVDLVVLLTHQGHTAPMQTDDEARPDIQRDIEADIALAGSVEGIDVLFGGHADAGTPRPVVHPRTGTLIMQTYGQGYHLGYLQLGLDPDSRTIVDYDGKLLVVDSDALPPESRVLAKLAAYRQRHPAIYEVIGSAAGRFNRQYNAESDLGNLFADILRQSTGATIGLMPSGALRKDIPRGDVALVDVLDAFPFEDKTVVVDFTGDVLLRILEQGLSLERGILQVSGLALTYDPAKPAGARIVEATVNGLPIVPDRIYRTATIEILAKGGDAYVQARNGEIVSIRDESFAESLESYFREAGTVTVPEGNRLIPIR